jgi:hypothetical protein
LKAAIRKEKGRDLSRPSLVFKQHMLAVTLAHLTSSLISSMD